MPSKGVNESRLFFNESDIMKSNINSIDKIIRIILAVALVILFFTGIVGGTAGIILLIIAIVLIATAAINFCPVWHVLGISTKNKEQQKEEVDQTI